MNSERALHLSLVSLGAGGHLAAWRYPGTPSRPALDFAETLAQVRRAEAAGFTAVFVADVVAIWGEHLDSLHRTVHASTFEPLTLLSALANATERIGLVATATTSYNEPYTLARKLASLDHISHGRAGWNVVTSVVPLEAGNYGREEHYSHAERYERADEFVRVVRGLWDSYADDAVVRDQAARQYYLPEGRRSLDFEGRHFRVAGPLNLSRPPQGYPVTFQAGASDTGIAFAARYADVVFAPGGSIDRARAYRARLDAALAAVGRDPRKVRVWPGLGALIGSTEEEARRQGEELRGLLDDSVLRRVVQDNTGDVDFSGFDLDAPLPELPETNRSISRQASILELARSEGLTLRQLALRLTQPELVGTPEQVADHIERWFREGVADGFNVHFPLIPHSSEPFYEEVVPLLRRRGLLRDHEGSTLRERLGLARPQRGPVPQGASE